MTTFNRATKKFDDYDYDFEQWFRIQNALRRDLRYAESRAEVRQAVDAFKVLMKRSKNRFFKANRVDQIVQDVARFG